jgi:hypothetical protein
VTIRRSVPLLVELAAIGVEEWGKGQRKTGYRLVSRPAPELVEAA